VVGNAAHRAHDSLQHATLQRLVASLVLPTAAAPTRFVGRRQDFGRLAARAHDVRLLEHCKLLGATMASYSE
jgi:hypothetical protein